MAYLNEFPHTEASKLNLDWILEQYSTFNQRLAEIVKHFDESVEQMQSDILQYKSDYETAFNNFKNDITSLVNEYNEKVDSINENIGGYVNEYLTENINTILQDNPVLDTKYERVGTIQPHSTLTINLTQNKMYDIMTLNYAFDMHKLIVSNNTYKFYIRPYVDTELVDVVTASEVMVPGVPDIGTVLAAPLVVGREPVAVPVLNAVTANINNLILTLTNNTDNVLTVYMKEII